MHGLLTTSGFERGSTVFWYAPTGHCRCPPVSPPPHRRPPRAAPTTESARLAPEDGSVADRAGRVLDQQLNVCSIHITTLNSH
ncbi:hypothetical protein ZHAS_00002045 [Anopheles sinensis]|uniref:Uncharacterized protein n=1 Tax=Anopheles sinensis TaxID=74873 RepID=A0A084VBR2_ANOSI|nr:hypothetical protein ZHAS_00002045 [Anopheles sinensis]